MLTTIFCCVVLPLFILGTLAYGVHYELSGAAEAEYARLTKND